MVRARKPLETRDTTYGGRGMSNETTNKIFKAVALQQEAAKKMREADMVLRGGPASYYEEKLHGYVSALFERFAPFKIGDRVRLIRAPKCEGGWAHHKHTLVVGREGTVADVDYVDGGFVADVAVDDQTYFGGDGKEHPIKRPYTFHLSERFIAKVEGHNTQEEQQ